jgi:hypothetical protein
MNVDSPRSHHSPRRITGGKTCGLDVKGDGMFKGVYRGAHADPAALTFLTMTTRPSFRAEFKAGEGGKTAVSMARWINTRGEKGPWSEVAMATVAA